MNMKMMRNLIIVNGTTDQVTLTTFTATYKKFKETLIDVIDDLARHSYTANLKIISS